MKKKICVRNFNSTPSQSSVVKSPWLLYCYGLQDSFCLMWTELSNAWMPKVETVQLFHDNIIYIFHEFPNFFLSVLFYLSILISGYFSSCFHLAISFFLIFCFHKCWLMFVCYAKHLCELCLKLSRIKNSWDCFSQ